MPPKGGEALPIWFQTGNCTDLGMDAGRMVPEPGDEEGESIAKAVCLNCNVEELCLGWARQNRRNDMGVYGGETNKERRNLDAKVHREQRRRNGR